MPEAAVIQAAVTPPRAGRAATLCLLVVRGPFPLEAQLAAGEPAVGHLLLESRPRPRQMMARQGLVASVQPRPTQNQQLGSTQARMQER